MKPLASSLSATASATSTSSSSLLTPLAGTRDLLPPESRARRKLSEALQNAFDRHGYDLITTPLFEHVDVFERGLSLDTRDLMRFVEPDSGDVAALRPDITPQIARVVATRLAALPPPFRIRYEGTVIRRRRGRARRQRQIAQVGVELIGIDSAEADAEVIALAADAVRAAGLDQFHIELSEVGVASTLLLEHGPHLLTLCANAIAQKDEAYLLHLLEKASVARAARDRIAAVLHLHGDARVIVEAKRLVSGTSALAHVMRLEQVVALLSELGLSAQLGVDLGEIRGATYYTGVSFGLFAKGPGEAVAAGGRYDQLLERYGRPLPATGAAIDVENLLWALTQAGAPYDDRGGVRFVLCGADAAPLRSAAAKLRAAAHAAAIVIEPDVTRALAYARAWSIDVLLTQGPRGLSAHRTTDGAARELGSELSDSALDALASWARDTLKE